MSTFLVVVTVLVTIICVISSFFTPKIAEESEGDEQQLFEPDETYEGRNDLEIEEGDDENDEEENFGYTSFKDW